MVCGPTASGKTSFSIELAKKNEAEIVSADSMQIYDGLNIGTAKPSPEQLAEVEHHLVGFLPPQQRYSVADYVKNAASAIQTIQARGRNVIVAGGTGLYISSLINGTKFTEDEFDPAVREKLWLEYEQRGADALYEKLVSLDENYASSIHKNNVKRVIRAIEYCECTGKKLSQKLEEQKANDSPYDAHVILLDFADRSMLYGRIGERVDTMVSSGLVEEAREVFIHRNEYETAAQAIGYKEFFPYFEGKSDVSECVAELKKQTRHYAKRQLSWFRNNRFDERIYVDLQRDGGKKI